MRNDDIMAVSSFQKISPPCDVLQHASVVEFSAPRSCHNLLIPQVGVKTELTGVR